MSEIILEINGMNCHHCVKAVEKALSNYNLDNLKVEIGRVSFDNNNNVDINKVIEAIEDEGYEVKK